MRVALTSIGMAVGLAALVLFLLAIVESFVFWLALLGIGGALFAIFLLPIAVLAQPLVATLLSQDPGFLLGYVQLGGAFFLIWVAGRCLEAAEVRAYRRARRKLARRPATRKRPSVS